MNGSKTLEKEFLEVLEGHKGVIYKVANAYQSDPEERQDLIQEIILQLWRAFPKYDPTFALTTWIYRISLNVAISQLRKATSQRKRRESYAEVLAFAQDEVREEQDEQVRQLYRFIEGLKPLDKAIVILFLEGKGNKEIAEIMGITASNVSTRMHRIKQRMTAHFKPNT